MNRLANFHFVNLYCIYFYFFLKDIRNATGYLMYNRIIGKYKQ